MQKTMAKVCEKCGGIGLVPSGQVYRNEPIMAQCSCLLKEHLRNQCERAWTGLSQFPAKKTTPLKGKLKENIIIHAEKTELCSHLKGAIFLEKNPSYFIKVVSDANLMSAWLSNISLAQSEIVDPDFTSLLIVRLGVKMARNSAMPEVLIETIELRQHLNKPTWIVVDPNRPLCEGHIAWSRGVDDVLLGWNNIRLVEQQEVENKKVPTLKI
jgi:hypothetical protein